MATPGSRLFIIGASGFIGQHLAREAGGTYEVVRGDVRPGPDCDVRIDVTSADEVDSACRQVQPTCVVLLAAVSDIDRCEREPELAEAVNVRGAVNVARACCRMGTRLLVTSSAAVFDGARHGYREDDPPTPVSVYGTTKARAEAAVAEILPAAVLLRLALVLGFAEGDRTNAMLNRAAERLRAGQPLVCPTFEYRNPIDAATLSAFLLELLRRPDARGVYHLGASDSISRFELGLRLADALGCSRDLIKPQTEPVPGRAPRGLDHFLLTDRLRAISKIPVPNCRQVMERACYGIAKGHS